MIIQADYLLAAILSDRDSISFDALVKVQRSIEKLCPGVAVDISSPAVLSALEYYPEMFERQGRLIARAMDANRYFSADYLDCEFIRAVPAKLHENVQTAIKTSLAPS